MDQIAVAGPDLTDGEVGFDVVAAAERAHEERALRVRGGLFLGDPALVDEPLDPGVVLRDLGQHTVPEEVGARVADVHEPEPLAGPQQGGERRAHALQLRVLLDHHPELVVGALHRRTERGEDVGAGDVVVERDEGGDHLGGGDLTGGLAAHAVGDGEQPGPGVARVLVALADHALVRARGESQRQSHAHLPCRRCIGVQPVSTHTAHPPVAPVTPVAPVAPVGSPARPVAGTVPTRSLRSRLFMM